MASRVRRQRSRPKGGARALPGVAGHEADKPSRSTIAWLIGVLTVAAGMLVWNQSTVYFLSWTDEQIHLYVARRMAEGAVLYRDIDSARPPLVLFPIAWLIKAGFSPLLAGRAMVVASQLATGLPVIMRDMVPSKPHPTQALPFAWELSFGGSDPQDTRATEPRNPAGTGVTPGA